MSASDLLPWDGEASVPMRQWGKDHWTTLAYLESVWIDDRGWIDNERMRCNPRRHREVAGVGRDGRVQPWDAKYSTRLRGTQGKLSNHDDWDCLNDLVEAGLVLVVDERRDPDKRGVQFDLIGGQQVQIRLTTFGARIAARLRHHLGERRPSHSFGDVLDAEPSVVGTTSRPSTETEIRE